MQSLEEYKKDYMEKQRGHPLANFILYTGLFLFLCVVTSPLFFILLVIVAVVVMPVGQGVGNSDGAAVVAFLVSFGCWIGLLARFCWKVKVGDEKDKIKRAERDWYDMRERVLERRRKEELYRNVASIARELERPSCHDK